MRGLRGKAGSTEGFGGRGWGASGILGRDLEQVASTAESGELAGSVGGGFGGASRMHGEAWEDRWYLQKGLWGLGAHAASGGMQMGR